MDLTQVPIDIWISQGIFCLLFIYLFYDTRKEAKAREDKLSAQIDKQNQQMGRIVQSLERLEQQISNLKEDK